MREGIETIEKYNDPARSSHLKKCRPRHLLPRAGIGGRISGAAVPDRTKNNPCGFD